ncbi:hypothetical protein U0A04_24725, partial [Escherichia coli]|nr:hypothetical protein [Escherichia coli]
NHTNCPLTDFGGKTSIFSHPVYLFLRKFSLQDSRGGSVTLGGEGELSPDLTLQNQMLYSLFNGYRNTWSGSLNA